MPDIVPDLKSRSRRVSFRKKEKRMESSCAHTMCKFPLPFDKMDDKSRIDAINGWKDWIDAKSYIEGNNRVCAIAFLSGSGNGKSHLIDYIQKNFSHKDSGVELVAITANDEMGVCS